MLEDRFVNDVCLHISMTKYSIPAREIRSSNVHFRLIRALFSTRPQLVELGLECKGLVRREPTGNPRVQCVTSGFCERMKVEVVG